jgi:ribosomal protein L4
MITIKKYDASGAEAGSVTIADEKLELERGEQAVHEVVIALNLRRRAGTASTLVKGAVSGTGAKPWKQKGTGRARAGYKQSPVWRGGGVVFRSASAGVRCEGESQGSGFSVSACLEREGCGRFVAGGRAVDG